MKDAVRDEVERVARLSYGRLVSAVASRTGRVDAAAEALSDALVKALEIWPVRGIPDRPEAWLVTTARNRARDLRRRGALAAAAEPHLTLMDQERTAMASVAVPDSILNLMFVCAHPAIQPTLRTPLMLNLVLGLDAARMARVFLLPPGTMGQRLTRARHKIEAARIGFALPQPEDLAPRLTHVMAAIYAAYTVGVDARSAGDDKASPLATEAIWLASLLADQMPGEPAPKALVALLLYVEARRSARIDAGGRFVPLEEQDSSLWNTRMMADADAFLGLASPAGLSRFEIEAAIQAAHCDRRHGRPTDWTTIAQLSAGLAALHPSAGAIIGFAAALGETQGPEAGLSVLASLDESEIRHHQPFWAVRADLLRRVGSWEAAALAYGQAIALTADDPVRRFLERQRRNCLKGAGPVG